MNNRKDVSKKLEVTVEQTITYIKDLIDGLKAGTVCIQEEDEYIALKPEEIILLEVKATQKKGKEKFQLELTWQKGDEMSQDIDLKITSKEPEVKETVLA